MPRSSKSRRKRSIAVNSDLYQWVEEQIGKGKFSDFDHAVEIAIEKLKDTKSQEKK